MAVLFRGFRQKIHEWEYRTDSRIVEFSPFTSCIGIAGRIKEASGYALIGVHLAVKIPTANIQEPRTVTPGDIDEVIRTIRLSNYVGPAVIGGFWDNWPMDILTKLVKELQILTPMDEWIAGKGDYAAVLLADQMPDVRKWYKDYGYGI